MHPDEAAFQSHLDSHPDDHTARLVFADWLEERGDPRAEGYRWLAITGRQPRVFGKSRLGVQYSCEPHWHDTVAADKSKVPADLLAKCSHFVGRCRVDRYHFFDGVESIVAKKRRTLDASLAFAFALLPAARRAELLAAAPVGA